MGWVWYRDCSGVGRGFLGQDQGNKRLTPLPPSDGESCLWTGVPGRSRSVGGGVEGSPPIPPHDCEEWTDGGDPVLSLLDATFTRSSW